MHRKTHMIRHLPFESSPSNYIKLIDIYTKWQALKSGKQFHAHLIINGLIHSTQFASKLIAFYTRCKELTFARKVFDEIPKSNIRGWVAMIGSYSRNGYYKEAVSMFQEMQKQVSKYDRIVLPSVLKACGKLCDQKMGEKLHAIVLRNEFDCDAFVMCALIDMYSKCGRVEKAKKVFDAMVEKDLVALNAMISGYVQNSFVKEALDLVNETRLLGVKPDIVTWNTLISGFSQANDESMVTEIFRTMESDGIKPDVISWTSVISGLVQNFQNKKAFSAFKQMMQYGLFPTASTISGLLPAFASLADLKHGMEIHGYSVVFGFEKDVYVRSALIDMYAKCGSISESLSLFQKTSEKNTVTWNSMIFAYANHGYCDKAIELFDKMLNEDEKTVDHLTFTAVLTACAHGGFVDLGKRLFESMKGKYDILPRLEHYACYVDLLGRAGNVDEAYGFIQRMPIEGDLFVWGALLGACKQHGCVDIAEIAAKELAKLERKSCGSSVVLFNMYAEYSSWGKAVKVKEMMKKRKYRGFCGCSWIQVL